MSMKVKNNLSATRSLGQLNINITELGKALAKVSSGQRINSAGDDAAGLAISEKMRVRIRALEQDIQNVKNGRAMLFTAEGGLQRQLDLMRTIKEKVIDAANDSNTDEDRLTIQKEIDHHFQEIQSIAYETDFNGIKLLIGNEPLRKIAVEYERLEEPEFVDGSDEMNVIKNKTHDTLDGIDGPFATFNTYSVNSATINPLLGSLSTDNFSGGGDGTPAHWDFNFDDFTSASDIIGHGFSVEANVDSDGTSLRKTVKSTYVFVDTTAPVIYNTSGYKDVTFIPINPNGDWRSQAAAGLANAANQNSAQSDYITGNALNHTATLSSTYPQREEYQTDILSTVATGSGYTIEIPYAPPSGLGTGQLSGGAEKVLGYRERPGWFDEHDAYHPLPSEEYTVEDGRRAKLEVDISNVTAGTGITVTGKDGEQMFVKFVDNGNACYPTNGGFVLNVPINQSPVGCLLDNGINLSVENGIMTLEAATITDADPSLGENTQGNSYYFTDGIPYSPSIYVTGIQPLTLPDKVDGVDGSRATYDIDLSAYDTTDADALEGFIAALKDKAIQFPSRTYEFLDSTNSNSLAAIQKIGGSTVINLQNLRTAVSNGTTIADAFINLMTAGGYLEGITNDNQKILRATSTQKGTAGNDDEVKISQCTLEQYPIDYGEWFEQNGANIDIPLDEFLTGKGFRFYCATCEAQWFNIQFTADGDDEDAPEGMSPADLHMFFVDVSSLADADLSTEEGRADAARTLTELICNKGNEKINHNYKFAITDSANVTGGTLVIYDTRAEPLNSTKYPTRQSLGAKITDGVVTDLIKTEKEVPVNEKRLVIQDTDKDSQQIILRIPQSTLNHIFQVKFDEVYDPSRYNVLTKRNRNFLLGWQAYGADAGTHKADTHMGALDRGINYLLDSITLVGAQGARLEMTESNVVTQLENETNSESTIRDADMAKEMTALTKSNVLAQAAQAMLAQANQNSAAVLSLLY